MMTKEQLEEIKIRCDAATEGPWRHVFNPDDDCWWIDYTDRFGNIANIAQIYRVQEESAADAIFITKARIDVSELVSEVKDCHVKIFELMNILKEVCEREDLGYHLSDCLQTSWALKNAGKKDMVETCPECACGLDNLVDKINLVVGNLDNEQSDQSI